jgi:hypothetical protein
MSDEDVDLDCLINAESLIKQLEDWIIGLRDSLTVVTLDDGGTELYRAQGRIEALKNVVGLVMTLAEEKGDESSRQYPT